MKYQKIIADEMKKRQLSGLKHSGDSSFRPNGQNDKGGGTRKELAKIAGTSEGNGVTFRYTLARPCILTVGAFSIFQSSAVRVRRILRNLGVSQLDGKFASLLAKSSQEVAKVESAILRFLPFVIKYERTTQNG